MLRGSGDGCGPDGGGVATCPSEDPAESGGDAAPLPSGEFGAGLAGGNPDVPIGALVGGDPAVAIDTLTGGGSDFAVDGLFGSDPDVAIDGLAGGGPDVAIDGLLGGDPDVAIDGLAGGEPDVAWVAGGAFVAVGDCISAKAPTISTAATTKVERPTAIGRRNEPGSQDNGPDDRPAAPASADCDAESSGGGRSRRRVASYTIFDASLRSAVAPRASPKARTDAKRCAGSLASARIMAASMRGSSPGTRASNFCGRSLMWACIRS